MDWMSSTPYSRDLGDQLRNLRESCAQLTGTALAELLDWHASKVSTIEKGKVCATDVDLAQYLMACGKGLDFLNEFTSRYRHAFDPCFAQCPGEPRTLMLAERAAVRITCYGPTAVPDLLQTASYAQQSLEHAGVTPKEIRATVEALQARQALLYAHNRPEFTFYLPEAALRDSIHGSDIWRGQITHLLRFSRILRVIPSGSHTQFHSGCTLLEFDKMPTVAYTDTDIARIFVQERSTVMHCKASFQTLDAVAFDSSKSRDLLFQSLGEDFAPSMEVTSND